MELLYLYLNLGSVKGIVEINLNANYTFGYSRSEGKVIGKKGNTIPECFYGKNIANISALVGNNGAGKSGLIESIIALWSSPKREYKEVILIFNERNIIKGYFQNISSSMSGCIKSGGTTYPIHMDRFDGKIYEKIHLIYYANMFEVRNYRLNRGSSISDISTMGLLSKEKEDNSVYDKTYSLTQDTNLAFFYSEFEKQIKFVSLFGTSNRLPIKIPTCVNAEFVNKDWEIERITKKDGFNDIGILLQKLSNSNVINLDKQYMFEQRILRCVFFALIRDFAYDPSINSNNKKEILDIIKKAFGKKISKKVTVDSFQMCLEHLSEKLKERKFIQSALLVNYIEFIIWFKENRKKIGDVYNENQFTIPFEASDKYIGLKAFYENYCKIAKVENLINFQWRLSTGENTLLGIYSRFYDVAAKVKEKNILILLDEIDSTLHPAWQQLLIDDMVQILPQIFNGKDIQIILATHSPIILSDIPKGNVVFMKRDAADNLVIDVSKIHEETFNANIASLFYDSFFMDKGSTGKFSVRKVNELIDALMYKENGNEEKRVSFYKLQNVLENLKVQSISEVEAMINLIGEPLLRNKLKTIFKYIINENEKI